MESPSHPPQKAIGILGALPEEVAMLTAAMETCSIHTHLGRQFHQGSLAGQPVVVVQGGVGKVRAATTAALLVAHFPLQGIIFTGVAGALADHLHMGDVVLAHAAIEHDFGTGRPEGFVLGIDFIPELRHPLAEADSALYDLIVAHPERIPLHPLQGRDPVIHQGLVATGDVFVADADLRRQIRERTGALVVEMEGAAVVRVAQEAGIPCLLVRSVSDAGDDTDFLSFFQTAALNSAAVVRTILQNLPPSLP
ncbi:5'-methylthioadenosine/adenosylhomocysteine nucleosidase [Synechococcus sp. JA-2-3B'a(2-13)]|jgi:adenosylhomocysteine nucleosidase|uniref:5'-methylthioadenosine/adenosylhomocysteine nucleosidase n=1 Tax=Synechococcus sp. (strain JA-2-3B'a(2-13)) TaxID=321332 RepID=UPI0000694E3E|nr:5'-methylthioadenosine/adenosylhomocysteine nucleosidase [Synechococcus sp. JA-2-3B'a(2-13)]ABD02257.1 MTA/SAH nucleosidase [Synechococcus sp. JA-2-3B'a(2-13)]